MTILSTENAPDATLCFAGGPATDSVVDPALPY